MGKLDKVIADVSCILDTLLAYRKIIQSGDCNSCKIKKECDVCPKPGELVRYNCAFYAAKEGETNE